MSNVISRKLPFIAERTQHLNFKLRLSNHCRAPANKQPIEELTPSSLIFSSGPCHCAGQEKVYSFEKRHLLWWQKYNQKGVSISASAYCRVPARRGLQQPTLCSNTEPAQLHNSLYMMALHYQGYYQTWEMASSAQLCCTQFKIRYMKLSLGCEKLVWSWM